jgi:hypothetical protein
LGSVADTLPSASFAPYSERKIGPMKDKRKKMLMHQREPLDGLRVLSLLASLISVAEKLVRFLGTEKLSPIFN